MSEIFAVFIPLIGSLMISVPIIIFQNYYNIRFNKCDSEGFVFGVFVYFIGVLLTGALLYRYMTGVELL